MRELLQLNIPVELVMTEKSLQVIFDELGLRITGASDEEKSRNIVRYIQQPEEKAHLLRVYGNQRLDAPPSMSVPLEPWQPRQ